MAAGNRADWPKLDDRRAGRIRNGRQHSRITAGQRADTDNTRRMVTHDYAVFALMAATSAATCANVANMLFVC